MSKFQGYFSGLMRSVLFIILVLSSSFYLPSGTVNAAPFIASPTSGHLLGSVQSSVNVGMGKAPAGFSNSALSLGWVGLLHNSMTGYLNAIAFVGNDLYIGGSFTFNPDGSSTPLHNIAKYSGGVWSALAHNGLDGTVNAFTVVGNDLYVGGSFSNTADMAVTNIVSVAKYDTVSQSWSGLANQGIGGPVFALAAVGSDVYVGGSFVGTADGAVVNLNSIAKYSVGVWSALAHKGLEGEVHAFALSGSDLYVGGNFAETFDVQVKNLNNVAKYSAGAWSPLPNTGLDGVVNALVTDGSDLYAGGLFTKTKDGAITNLNHITKLSGGTWSPLAHNGLNGLSIRTLTVSGNYLYTGGSFSATFDNAVTSLNNIARYDPLAGSWTALPNQGLSSDVLALMTNGTDLYVGGKFGGTGDAQYTGQIVKLGPSPQFNMYLPLLIK